MTKSKKQTNDAARHETATQVVQLSGAQIVYQLAGQGEPAILLLSGHRTPLSSWREVVAGVSKHATVLAYDRPGTGASSKAQVPQDGGAVTDLLNELTAKLQVDQPFVVVAHSLGGLYANLYARLYPDRVAALVLVEAGHPQQAQEQEATKVGLLAKTLSLFQGSFRKDPNSEFNNVAATVQQIKSAGAFPDIPVVVVTGAKKMPLVPAQAFASHQRWQKELLKLSGKSTQVIAQQSGHLPQLSEPQLVVDAITSVL